MLLWTALRQDAKGDTYDAFIVVAARAVDERALLQLVVRQFGRSCVRGCEECYEGGKGETHADRIDRPVGCVTVTRCGLLKLLKDFSRRKNGAYLYLWAVRELSNYVVSL